MEVGTGTLFCPVPSVSNAIFIFANVATYYIYIALSPIYILVGVSKKLAEPNRTKPKSDRFCPNRWEIAYLNGRSCETDKFRSDLGFTHRKTGIGPEYTTPYRSEPVI